MSATQEIKFRGSCYDVVRKIAYGGYLPKERAGYILAKYALSQSHNKAQFDVYGRLALHRLTDEETADEHQPPLSQELRDLTRELLEANGDRVDIYCDAALILAWAVDEGERG